MGILMFLLKLGLFNLNDSSCKDNDTFLKSLSYIFGG